MAEIERVIQIDLPPNKSAFLWGPRQTGKSTYLRHRFPDSVVYDFLKTDLFLEISKRPALLREQVLAMNPKALEHPIILDEVQKVPTVLDEVHWLIENTGTTFVLCGSSARKLRRGNVNLLGGRAWHYEMFPLTSRELNEIDLLRILNRGMVPSHYLDDHYRKSLKAYTQDYLKEEIFDEGLVRNLPAFSRFFEAMGYSHGEMINFSNIARDCGVNSKTVKEYYQILVDTLVGKMIAPFKRRQDRHVITKTPKFYLFDVGIAGAIRKTAIPEEKGEAFGKAFEHFIFMEIVAYNGYKELDFDVEYWRTKSGQEVDFVLGRGDVAIEVKGTSRVDNNELTGIKAFVDSYSPRSALVVCNEKRERVVGPVRILPWWTFLDLLWSGEVVR